MKIEFEKEISEVFTREAELDELEVVRLSRD
jgi:hypothetical protein